MRNELLTKAAVLLLGVALLAPLASQKAVAADKKDKAEPPAPMKLKVGDMAPNFTLLEFTGKDLKKVALSDFRGKKDVVVAFYVFAFTGG